MVFGLATFGLRLPSGLCGCGGAFRSACTAFWNLGSFVGSEYLAMSDFKNLDPETRAFAMVGQFLQTYAKMEEALHDAIGTALSIDPIKMKILAVNIEFSKKIQILRTLIDISESFTDQERTTAKSKCKKMITFAENRNIVAHTYFRPDCTNKGVEFKTIKASGDFSADGKIWLDDEFLRVLAITVGFEKLLDEIETKFQSKPIDPSLYVSAFQQDPFWYPAIKANRRQMMQAAIYHQSPQVLGFPDSGPPNEESNPQTPDKRQEKE
jgi:hypothetical protein